MSILIDDGSTHCNDCFSPSHDTNFGYGEVAIPEGCSDETCECHNPSPVAHALRSIFAFVLMLLLVGMFIEAVITPDSTTGRPTIEATK